MPNRILKESICTSDSVDGLSWFEEVFFYRLIVNCDDFGRFDARPAILKSRMFPLKESVTAANVQQTLDKLVAAGLVALYEREGKPYLQLPTWGIHQQIRAARSKYPAPEGNEAGTPAFPSSGSGCKQLIANDINCNQMISNDINCNHLMADVPVIQSESYSKSESNTKDDACTQASAPQKQAYGEFGKVLLTEREKTALEEKLGKENCVQLIGQLDGYIASSGRKYKSHYATLLNWQRRKQEEACARQPDIAHQEDKTLLLLEKRLKEEGRNWQ